MASTAPGVDHLVRASSGTERGGVAEWFRQGPAKPCTRVRFPPPPRAISSVGERYLDTVEVTGSIPVSPTRHTHWSHGPSVIFIGGPFGVGGSKLGAVDLDHIL